MKSIGLICAGLMVGGMLGGILVAQRSQSRHRAELERRQAVWLAEKSALEAELGKARQRPGRELSVPMAPRAQAAAPSPKAPPTPAEIIERLRQLKGNPGAPQTRALRHLVHDLEELIAAGPAAAPAIREFLARFEDVDFDPSYFNARRGSLAIPQDFVVPPSLRFGLLDALRQIGGPEAEAILSETLAASGRGAEVAWLARTLEQMAPNRYRDAALTAARDLLQQNPAGPNGWSPMENAEREQLFGVLSMYGDNSYVSAAQTQLVQANGVVDTSALRYLQKMLGPKAVGIAAQTWQDPRLSDPARREPLARVALVYAGADDFANQFYEQAINDLTLSKDHRRNLIEDLNQDGFANLRNLGIEDLPLIENRIALIERLAPKTSDPVNAAAFQEAYKDLLNMRTKAMWPPNLPRK